MPTRTVDLDVLDEANAAVYWDRDERHDLAISLNSGRPALAALCRVLERWIAHFLGVAVTIEPKREIDDKRWVWHVGLDAEASALLNDLFNRVEVDEERMGRLLVSLRAQVRESCRHASGDCRPSRLSRDGDGCAVAAQAETAEPASQPSARARPNDASMHPSVDQPDSALPAAALSRRSRTARTSPLPARPPRPPLPLAERSSLAPLAWLDGCWRGTVNEREFREHWMPLRGGLMLGVSQTVIGGEIAGLRIPADRVAAGRRLLRCAPVGRQGGLRSSSSARPSTPRTTATTRSSRSKTRRSSFRERIIYRRANGRLALRAGRGQGERRRPPGDLPDAPDRLRIGRRSSAS